MIDFFLNLIFPKKCLNCNFSGKWLCDYCKLKLLNSISDRKCKICFNDLKPFHCCQTGKKDFFSLLDYKNEITAKLIRGFKYQYLTELIDEVFGGLLEVFWDCYGNYFNDDFIIVPIPIHNKKQLRRGFNQSELIARKLSLISGLEVENDLLIRVINNMSQAGSGDVVKRKRNTEGIFKVNYCKISKCFNKDILLIDDVYTTGCTVEEAKKFLNSVGFGKISVLVLAMN